MNYQTPMEHIEIVREITRICRAIDSAAEPAIDGHGGIEAIAYLQKLNAELGDKITKLCEIGCGIDERYLEIMEIAKSHKEDIVHHLGDRINVCVNGQVYLGTLLAPNAVIVRRYEPGSTRLMSSRHDEPDEEQPQRPSQKRAPEHPAS